ncbi:unnamed protein product [Amoebophrya sp. A120]|nr:unnamed protein product [Amoebophrya sp. A120]|eukprot:GSA120T00017842001.1
MARGTIVIGEAAASLSAPVSSSPDSVSSSTRIFRSLAPAHNGYYDQELQRQWILRQSGPPRQCLFRAVPRTSFAENFDNDLSNAPSSNSNSNGTSTAFAEGGEAAKTEEDEPKEMQEGEQIDENVRRQVVNNYPVLPFVIPIPTGGASSSTMSRSKNTAREIIPSAHDLGSQAKWNGFWKTVQDVAALKLTQPGAGSTSHSTNTATPFLAQPANLSAAPRLELAKRPESFTRGMVGADFVYESPINALGQPDITAPVSVPGSGIVVDSGNPFF